MPYPKGRERTAKGRTARIDMTGKQFGEWTVLERDLVNRRNWLCRCSCGTERSVDGVNLRKGLSTSCNHKRIENWRAKCDEERSQLVGEAFGLLTVTRTYQNAGDEGMAHCRCACGNMTSKRVTVLVRGEAVSCGCLNQKASSDRARLRNATGRGFKNLAPSGAIG